MTEFQPKDLFGKLLHEPNFAERAKIVNSTLDGLPPNEATSVLFTTLCRTVDYLQAVLEIAASSPSIDTDIIMQALPAKLKERSSQYVDQIFNAIVEPLGES